MNTIAALLIFQFSAKDEVDHWKQAMNVLIHIVCP